VNAPSSLFVFLHRQLRLSKGAASYRATAAALIQRIPEVVEPLRDGLLCLSTIRRGREAANVERDLDAPDAPQRPS
jgi:hypothetical protein